MKSKIKTGRFNLIINKFSIAKVKIFIKSQKLRR